MRLLILHFVVGASPPLVFYALWLVQGPEGASVLWVVNLFAGIAPHVPVLEDYVTYAVQNRRGDLVPLMIAVYSYDFLWILPGTISGAILVIYSKQTRESVLWLMVSRYRDPMFGVRGLRGFLGLLIGFIAFVTLYAWDGVIYYSTYFGVNVVLLSFWILFDFALIYFFTMLLMSVFGLIQYMRS